MKRTVSCLLTLIIALGMLGGTAHAASLIGPCSPSATYTPARRACFFFGDCNMGANYEFPDEDSVINVRIFENTQADETTDGDFMNIVF